MSNEFVNLNEIFLPTIGGDIEGDLEVNGALTVNDKSGNGTTYDVADEIAKLYPIGHVVITDTNTSPADTIGGTWTLIDREFTPYYGTATTTANTTNASSFVCEFVRGGHNLRLRFKIVTTVTIGDTALEMGTVDLSSLGISRTLYSVYQYPMGNDGSGGFGMFQMIYNTGVVSSVEALGEGTSELAAGTFYGEINLTIVGNAMLDNACNKFYWKRTA